MRLLALRADTMRDLRQLRLPYDEITPAALWGSDTFLIGVTDEQFEVLRSWKVEAEDVTPAALRDLHADLSAIPGGSREDEGPVPSAAVAEEAVASPAPAASPASLAISSRPARGGAGKPGLTSPAAVMRGSTARGIPSAPSPIRAPADAAAALGAITSTSDAPAARSVSETPRADAVSEVPSANDDAGEAPELTLDAGTGAARAARAERGRAVRTGRGAPHPGDDTRERANAGKLRMTVGGEHLYAEIVDGRIVLKERSYDSLAHARDSVRRERNAVPVWEYFDEGANGWRVLNRD